MSRGELSNHLAYGAFENFTYTPEDAESSFGKLTVPSGMKPVSAYRRTDKPLLTMPFGPPQPWLMPGHEGAGSSMVAQFGSPKAPLSERKVNQSGYLSLWDAQPRSMAPSWNPLLMQGANVFPQSPNGPMLSDVVPVSQFGRRSSIRNVGKVTKKKATKKVAKGKTARKTTKKTARKTTKKRS